MHIICIILCTVKWIVGLDSGVTGVKKARGVVQIRGETATLSLMPGSAVSIVVSLKGHLYPGPVTQATVDLREEFSQMSKTFGLLADKPAPVKTCQSGVSLTFCEELLSAWRINRVPDFLG